MTDKINTMQYKGIINFEKYAKISDGQYFPEQNQMQDIISSDRNDQLSSHSKKY